MRKLLIPFSLMILASLACERETRVEIPSATYQDLALLHPESSVIAYFDFTKTSQSPLAKEVRSRLERHLKNESHDQDYEEFKQATGFDPERDFHSVLVGASAGPDSEKSLRAIVHGQFDEDRITDFVRQRFEQEKRELPWQEEDIDGHTLYTSVKKPEQGLCFADTNTLYLGDRQWIISILTGTPAESRTIAPELLASLEKNIRYGDQFWVEVDLTRGLKSTRPFSTALQHSFPRIEELNLMAFSARVTAGVEFEGRINCENDETCKLLVDLMKGALAAAKLRVSRDRPAVDALNRIKIERHGDKAVMHGKLDEKFFDMVREQKLFFWDEECEDVI